MQIMFGTAAFSLMKRQKLLELLQKHVPSISQVDTRYIHLVDSDSELNDEESTLLNSLLEYGESCRNQSVSSEFKIVKTVLPRMGTISPWSSKAQDILRNCGLCSVSRIERGIEFQILSAQVLGEDQVALLEGLIHDRMTEVVISDFSEATELFQTNPPKPLQNISVMEEGEEGLKQANVSLGLALAADEVRYLLDQFNILKRNPTDVELMMFAQANSEHCRHKIFNASWEVNGISEPHSLFEMIKHTHSASPDGVLSAYSDNAAVMRGYEGHRFFPNENDKVYQYREEPVHILMKVETHNHPTAIAPFPGAATGSGGEIRDEGATGTGAKPKAGLTGFSVSNLKVPGFAQPWEEDFGKPAHISSALEIMLDGPIGGAAFNNEFGRPALTGYFRTFEDSVMDDTGHQAVRGFHKPIMIAGGLGNIRESQVLKEKIKKGSSLIVLGGPAMLIGLGGGAASSMTSGAGNEQLDFASVQRDNPEMERRCQEVIDACWQLGVNNPIAFIHDVGAGGLSNALPELVKDGGCGGSFDLRKVPSSDSQMSPLEIWCNESQERYVIAVAPDRLDIFSKICERERCPFALVGEAIGEKKIEVIDSYFEDVPIDLPMEVLFGNPPKMHRKAGISIRPRSSFNFEGIGLVDAIDRVLSLPSVASKSFLITIGDRTITGMVNRDQMVGPWQVPVADAAVTANSYLGFRGEAMAMGERSPVALFDAAASGRMAISEALTNIMSADIKSIGDVKLSANWMVAAGYASEDAKLYQTVQAVAMDLCPKLGVCIPVGKDSMSMRTVWKDKEDSLESSNTAPLSLVVTAFGCVEDIRRTLTPELDNSADTHLFLIDLSRGKNRLGGSALGQVFRSFEGPVADLDSPEELIQMFKFIQLCRQRGLLLAYHDRSDGGVLTTLFEMAFASHVGLDITLREDLNEQKLIESLFAEELGAVIQVKSEDYDEVFEIADSLSMADSLESIASIRDDDFIKIYSGVREVFTSSRIDLHRIWAQTSYKLQCLRDNSACAKEEFDALLDPDDPGLTVKSSFDLNVDIAAPYINVGSKPRVAILREQGVNGQLEMGAAFDRAHFESVDVHMTDLIAGRQTLGNFNLFAACGGFSYGDVLGAGGGWAKTILFNSSLRDQFASFFDRKDTLAFGVCNGCQMMSHLTELIPGTENWPKFFRNKSEQFEGRFSLIKVDGDSSVFFNGMKGSQFPIAVAHGEGKAVFDSEETASSLKQSGNITLRYIDNYGEIAEQYPANPNGSIDGIAGVCNDDGRVSIMMPHPERVFRASQNSWHPNSWRDDAPSMRIFRNARVWFD